MCTSATSDRAEHWEESNHCVLRVVLPVASLPNTWMVRKGLGTASSISTPAAHCTRRDTFQCLQSQGDDRQTTYYREELLQRAPSQGGTRHTSTSVATGRLASQACTRPPGSYLLFADRLQTRLQPLNTKQGKQEGGSRKRGKPLASVKTVDAGIMSRAQHIQVTILTASTNALTIRWNTPPLRTMDFPTTSCSSDDLSIQQVVDILESKCEEAGMQIHPFLIGWYNQSVSNSKFHLPYPEHTVALLLISTPSMFEKLFVPYVTFPNYKPGQLDPLDQCLKQYFYSLAKLFPPVSIDIIQDFEMDPVSRRPRILVQTAGHVSGAARYYQRVDVDPDPWPKEKKIFGVSVHPKFGGFFAFRGVLIFKQLLEATLKQSDPPDCVPDQVNRIELLNRFNFNWKDWTFREIVVGGAGECYSELQRQYFSTVPGQRHAWIQNLRIRHNDNAEEIKLDKPIQ